MNGNEGVVRGRPSADRDQSSRKGSHSDNPVSVDVGFGFAITIIVTLFGWKLDEVRGYSTRKHVLVQAPLEVGSATTSVCAQIHERNHRKAMPVQRQHPARAPSEARGREAVPVFSSAAALRLATRLTLVHHRWQITDHRVG